MDPLDHIRPIEHERLMTLALETAVILLGELEHLQSRAHAAVKDDNALLGRSYVVALSHEKIKGPGEGRVPLSQRPSRSWGGVLGATVVSGASVRGAPIPPLDSDRRSAVRRDREKPPISRSLAVSLKQRLTEA